MKKIAFARKQIANGMANAASALIFTAAGKTKSIACGIKKVNR
jgi:hypothetical protein